jgi:Kelch motif protein
MSTFRSTFAVVALVVAGAVVASTASSRDGARAAGQVVGRWQRLPAAPIAPEEATSVWAGRQMIVFGRDQRTALDAHGKPYSIGSVNVAASYDPVTRRWRRLSPSKGPGYSPSPRAVWTGRELLVWGTFDGQAYDPRTNHWRALPPPPTARGFAVWTGREMIGWGGGCCGDAFSDGSAYDPRTNHWRRLSRSPLAGGQEPHGVWTGRELIVLVGNVNPATGKPWPARLARAAAYDPGTNRWRRIPRPPAPTDGAAAVWDGRELLVVGGVVPATTRASRRAYAYDPGTNAWRQIASLPSGRSGAVGVWAGSRMVLLGGGASGARALAYDPHTNAWAVLPRAPVPPTLVPTAVWTGRALDVWGVVPTRSWGSYRTAGAVFTLGGTS